jgi:hypothetical protein
MEVNQRPDDVGAFGANPEGDSSVEKRSDPNERQAAIQEAKTEDTPSRSTSIRTTKKTTFEAPQ